MAELAGVNNDVEEALRAAAAETEPEVADSESVDGKVPSTSGGKGKSVPRDGSYVPRERLNEALNKVRELETAVAGAAKLQEEVRKSQATSQTLQEQLAHHQNLIGRIQALAGDDRYREHVLKIDAALKGAEYEIEKKLDEKVDAAEKTGNAELKAQLEAQKEEILGEVREERARSLLVSAQGVAARYLEALPDVYTPEHKAVVAELWNNKVDWAGIEDNPEIMNAELARALQDTLDKYPLPGNERTTEDQEEVAKPLSAIEELARIKDPNLNWGKTDAKGKPAVSDEDFVKVLAHAHRLERQARQAAGGR
jgi:hypothetical protein